MCIYIYIYAASRYLSLPRLDSPLAKQWASIEIYYRLIVRLPRMREMLTHPGRLVPVFESDSIAVVPRKREHESYLSRREMLPVTGLYVTV